MFSTKFVFFMPLGKPRWPSHCLIGLEIFYSSEQNSTKLDRKEDLNVLHQVLFSGQSRLLPWPICRQGGIVYSGARYWALLVPCLTVTRHSNKTGNTFLFLSSCGTCKHTIIDRVIDIPVHSIILQYITPVN